MNGKPRRLLALISCLFLLAVMPCVSADSGFSGDPDAVERAADSVFMLEVYRSDRAKVAIGSGFVAFDPSIIVTNYHVIEDGAYVVAISDDSERYYIDRVCIADKNLDLAILKLDTKTKARPLPLDTADRLKRSQTVVAIGSPAGLKNTVSIGNISGFYDQKGKSWIQFTAPISSGSSGGVLFDDDGEVIGITTATYASTQNVNLAVRASSLLALYRKWDGRSTKSLASVTGHQAPAVSSQAASQTPSGSTVWITASGKKYHSNPNCSKMRSPREIDLMEAISGGYEPCGKCYK